MFRGYANPLDAPLIGSHKIHGPIAQKTATQYPDRFWIVEKPLELFWLKHASHR
jgi:hypothetical protein